jgi:excisionase family DNA binding protein
MRFRKIATIDAAPGTTALRLRVEGVGGLCMGRPETIGGVFKIMAAHDAVVCSIHHSALPELGLPADLPVPRPGERRPPHEWVMSTPGVSQRSLGPAIEREKSEVLIGAYHDGGDPFADAKDGGVLLAALTAFRDALEWEYRHSAMMTGWHLIHGCWRHGPRRARLETLDVETVTLPELDGVGGGQAEIPYGSWTPDDPPQLDPSCLIGAWDVNGQRLSACSRLPLGFGEAIRVPDAAAAGFERAPGYHRVTSVAEPYKGVIPPVLKPGWHTTPRVMMAAYLNIDMEIAESWVWPQQAAYLDPFYDRMRVARERLHGDDSPGGRLALTALKQCYLLPFGRLRSAKMRERQDRWWRPAWYDTIIGQELAREYLRLHKLAAAGRRIFGVYYDTILIATSDGAAPPELPVDHHQLGKYKPVGTPMPATAAENLLHTEGVGLSGVYMALQGELDEDRFTGNTSVESDTVDIITNDDAPRLLNTSEAAAYLSVSAESVRRWTIAGKLECYRTPGGQRRFDRAQLDAVLEQHG